MLEYIDMITFSSNGGLWPAKTGYYTTFLWTGKFQKRVNYQEEKFPPIRVGDVPKTHLPGI